MGNLTRMVNLSLGQNITYTYDANGKRITQSDPASPMGEIIEYHRDPLGQILEISRSGESLAKMEWDQLGRLTKRGMANGTRDLKFYDALGRTIGIARQERHGGRWDKSYPRESDEDDDDDFDYDEDHDYGPTYGADFPGALFAVPNTPIEETRGKRSWKKRGHRGPLKDLKKALNSFKYQIKDRGWRTKDVMVNFYDPAGNVKAKFRSKGFTFYRYDPNDRLIGENPWPSGDDHDDYDDDDYQKHNKRQIAYGYDPVGNRTWMEEGRETTSYSYNEADWLIAEEGYRYVRKIKGVSNKKKGKKKGKTPKLPYLDKGHLKPVTIAYQYDPNGNLSEESWGNFRSDYSHDELGRLTGIEETYESRNGETLQGLTRSFAYDALGRQVSRTAGGFTGTKNPMEYHP